MSRSRDLIFTILGIDRGSPAFNKVAAAADKAGNRLDRMGKVSTAALGGTAAAALAAGVGIAGALGGVAVVAGVAGLAIAANNADVADSFNELWDDVAAGSKEAAAPLTSDLMGIRNQLGETYDFVQPRLKSMFSDSVPAVHALVDGVDGLVREAMPGLQVAAKSSQAPMEGVRDLLVDTGRGVTDFFTNLSKGSESSGRIVHVFGGIIRDALGFAGDMLARLSNEGAPSVQRFGEVFHQLTGVITQLSSGALPVLFQGVTAGLNVFSGLVSIVGGASAQIGPLIGLAVSAGVALKAMDTITFGGLSAQLGNLKTEIGNATTLGGKFKAGLLGVLGGIGPLGLAAGGLGIMLGMLGQRQQAAAKATAEHEARNRALTDALIESDGVITANIQQTQIKAGQDAKLYALADRIGVSQKTMTSALLGSKDAIGEVNDAFEKFGITAEGTGEKFAKNKAIFDGFDNKNTIGSLALATSDAKRSFDDLTGGMLADKDAAAKVASEQRNAAEATETHTQAAIRLQDVMLGFVNKDLAYRSAVNSEAEAHQRSAEAIRDHGAASQEATAANLAWEQSAIQSVGAAGALAEANYTGSNATERAKLKMEAQNAEILRLASIAGNDAPPALRQMIGGLDSAALSALGVKIRAGEAGTAIAVLPNGKEITLSAKDLATPTANNVKNTLDGIRDKTVILRVVATGDILSSAGGRHIAGLASGGPMQAGQPYLVGEQGPELVFPDRDGWVATAAETDRVMARSGGGGAVGGQGSVTNIFNFGRYLGSRDELVRELRDAIHQQGRGSAERFFAVAP